MNGFFDITSIIFLVIAVVVFMRLASVLGRRTGNEPRFDPTVKPSPAPSGNDNVVSLPRAGRVPSPRGANEPDLEALKAHGEPGSRVYEGLAAIAREEPGFDADHFLEGARAAYEMIVTAFAEGDRQTLKNLLAPDVYEGFVEAIAEREAAGERNELTFVGLEEARIVDAELERRTARITVRFTSEVISVTRDAAGTVVHGDPTSVQTNRDAWTFAREAGARDPNWKLVATEAV